MSMSWSSWPPTSLRSPAIGGSGRPDAVALGRDVGVLEEGGVDAGVAHDQGQPVERALAAITGRTTSSAASMISRRRYRSMPSLSHTATKASSGVLPAPAPKRRSSRRSAVAPARAAKTSWPRRDRGSRARGSPPAPRRRARRPAPRRGRNVFQDHRAGGVDDVDALAAGVDHDAGLTGQHLRRLAVAIIRKPTVSSPSSRASAKCWPRCRPRCSGWRSGRSTPPRSAPARMSSLVPSPAASARRSSPASPSRPRS